MGKSIWKWMMTGGVSGNLQMDDLRVPIAIPMFGKPEKYVFRRKPCSRVPELTIISSCYLVGGWATPLKNMKVNWDDEIPNRWENKIDVPNHQPAIISSFDDQIGSLNHPTSPGFPGWSEKLSVSDCRPRSPSNFHQVLPVSRLLNRRRAVPKHITWTSTD